MPASDVQAVRDQLGRDVEPAPDRHRDGQGGEFDTLCSDGAALKSMQCREYFRARRRSVKWVLGRALLKEFTNWVHVVIYRHHFGHDVPQCQMDALPTKVQTGIQRLDVENESRRVALMCCIKSPAHAYPLHGTQHKRIREAFLRPVVCAAPHGSSKTIVGLAYSVFVANGIGDCPHKCT